MFLDKFESFREIYIQCHDNPDADAIASGYGLYLYFEKLGKKVHLIYSGSYRITKPSLNIMIHQLDIPIEYRESISGYDLLLTVDCQYRGGNTTPHPAQRVAMIDHHPQCVSTDEWCVIKEEYGSCCTVVWELLQQKGFEVNDCRGLATAMYYGLFSDTGQLSEIFHPKDKEFRDYLRIDRDVMDQLVKSNLLREELQIAGEALADYYYDDEYSFAVIKTRPCDPNLLGVINDLAIQVDTIRVSIVYSQTPIGYKFSVRSDLKEAMAAQVARWISKDLGSGGGHINKAGGFILSKNYERQYPQTEFDQFLKNKLCEWGKKHSNE